MAEAGRALMRHTVTVMLDLKKAFEKISHALLWEIGCRHKFPKRRLAMLIKTYAGQRCLKFGKIASRFISTNQGVIAGCSDATTMMILFTWGAYDQVYTLWPSLTISVVVDDGSLQATGTEADAARIIIAAAKMLCRLLVRIGLELSPNKGHVIATTPKLARQVEMALSDWAFRRARVVRQLGHDRRMGGGGRIPTHRGRVAAVGRRVPRFRRLAQGGRQMGKLFRSGGLASVGYTAKVQGMSDTQLQKVRSLSGHAQFGSARGRSRTMEFLLSHCPRSDPTFIADEYPLAYWMKAKWEQWVRPKAMALAFMHAQNHTKTWQSVKGPAGAVLMTLRRMGWRAESWKVWFTERGSRVDLDDIGVGTLRKLVNVSTKRRLLAGVPGSRGMEGLVGPPILEPALKEISDLRKKGDFKGAGLLRTWLAGGFFNQVRLHDVQATESPLCAICGVEEGTDLHRCFRCDWHLTERQDWSGFERKLMLWGRNEYGQDHPCTMMLCKGLFPDPLFQLPDAVAHHTIRWHVCTVSGLISGVVCVDGSCIFPHCEFRARGGWAFCMIDAVGNVIAAASGPVPFPWQTSGAAELFAARQAILHKSQGQLHLVTDFKELFIGWQAGHPYGTHSGHQYAELW
eukprot:915064-Pyramimonas_sp.AAC.1